MKLMRIYESMLFDKIDSADHEHEACARVYGADHAQTKEALRYLEGLQKAFEVLESVNAFKHAADCLRKSAKYRRENGIND